MMVEPMAQAFEGAPAEAIDAFLLASGLVGFVLAVIVLALKRRSR